MYAVVARANTSCASDIVGVIQNASRNPKYSGCLTNLYGSGVRNEIFVYGLPTNCSQTCRSPKRSKWLIRNVTMSTVDQPAANSVHNATRAAGSSIDQILMP